MENFESNNIEDFESEEMIRVVEEALKKCEDYSNTLDDKKSDRYYLSRIDKKDNQDSLEKSIKESACEEIELLDKKPVRDIFDNDRIDNAKELIRIMKESNFSQEFLTKEEVNKVEEIIANDIALKIGVRNADYQGIIDYISEIEKEVGDLDICENILQMEAVRNTIIKEVLGSFYFDDELYRSIPTKKTNEIMEWFDISAEDLLLASKKDNNIKLVLDIIEGFELNEEFIHSKEGREVAEHIILETIKKGELYKISNIKEMFNVSDDFMSSENMQLASREGFMQSLKEGWIDNAIKINDMFNLDSEFAQEAIEKYFIYHVKNASIGHFKEMKKKFNISEEFMQSEAVQEAAQEAIALYIKIGVIDTVDEIKSIFNISEEFMQSEAVQEAAQEAFLRCFQYYRINEASIIKDRLWVPEEFMQSEAVQSIITEAFLRCFKENMIDEAFEIRNKFNLPTEVVHLAIEENFERYLEAGEHGNVFEMIDKFNIEVDVSRLMNKIPKLRLFFEGVKLYMPLLYEKCLTNIRFCLPFLKIEDYNDFFENTVRNNPFLVEALLNNEKHGIKLLNKFNEFDSKSKKNISSLYKWKKEVLEENPDIDENSVDFRVKIQEKIKMYQNNKEILEDIECNGIDSERWLGYREEESFMLNEREVVDFSKIIETPLNRINESVFRYIDNINASLDDFREELMNHETYSDDYLRLVALFENIEKEVEKEKNNPDIDLGKIKGMEKGIENIQKKMEKLKNKSISSFEKIDLKVASLTKSSEEVKDLNNHLIDLEELMEKENSNELAKEISNTKEKLKKEFFSLRNNLNSFKDKEFKGVITEALGLDRAEAITQEIEEGLNEEFSHLQADIDDLSRIFSQKQKQNGYEGKIVGINVWNRNPDIDLYQGNYSPCCISIESGCGFSRYESAIADYMTDLAIQIVNITDKEKGIPIAAAWCWLGIDKHGKKCFVIDNIEGNTDYTNKYSQLLESKLKNYVLKYATSIGFEREDIVQGESYNDLELGFKSEVGKKLVKIGPCNRRNGYYLEAEDE